MSRVSIPRLFSFRSPLVRFFWMARLSPADTEEEGDDDDGSLERMDKDRGGPGCAVVSRRKRKRDEEGEERAASPLCRHSSPLTFTSSTSDGGQILIQLGRINRITMASPLPSPEFSSVASPRHESLPLRSPSSTPYLGITDDDARRGAASGSS